MTEREAGRAALVRAGDDRRVALAGDGEPDEGEFQGPIEPLEQDLTVRPVLLDFSATR